MSGSASIQGHTLVSPQVQGAWNLIIKDKLKRYLIKLTGDDYEESVREYVDSFYQEIKEKLESVRSDMYGMMKNEFAS